MTEWVEESETESDDDTIDSEEEWHQVKGQDVDFDHIIEQ